MIKIALLKIVRFFYRLLSKIIYLVIPIISKILIILKLNSRIINQLNKLRSESHRTQNHTSFVKTGFQRLDYKKRYLMLVFFSGATALHCGSRDHGDGIDACDPDSSILL